MDYILFHRPTYGATDEYPFEIAISRAGKYFSAPVTEKQAQKLRLDMMGKLVTMTAADLGLPDSADPDFSDLPF